MKRRLLLGINSDNEIVFANIEISDNKIFTVTFNYVIPFDIDDEDMLLNKAKELLGCYDTNYLYNLCVDYDCAPSDLPEVIINNWNINDIIDCSLIEDVIEIPIENSNCINRFKFESVACGQINPEELKVYTDKKMIELLISIWDACHLHELPNWNLKQINNIIQYFDSIDETKLLQDYIIYLTK